MPWCGWYAASPSIIKEWKNDRFADHCGGFCHVFGHPGAAVRLERKKYALRHVRLPAHRGGDWGGCGACAGHCLCRARKGGGLCLVPVWVTGGIHLDGYADTCDALSSYGDREKKLEILKDPHCGAFAVIRLCSYFAATFALCTCVQFTPRVGRCWTLALVLERALSGLAVASFPMAKNTGLAHTFATAADKTAVRRVLAVLAALLCMGMAGAGRLGAGAGSAGGALALPCCEPEAVRRHHRRSGRVVFAKGRALDAGGAVCLPVGRAVMIFITGPLYSGKRTFAQSACPARRIADVQELAAEAEDLEKLADELSAYDIVIATEVGGGVVPMDASSVPPAKPPGGWPACWRHGPSAWCRCSAASPRY